MDKIVGGVADELHIYYRGKQDQAHPQLGEKEL
jgi:hypothetical protein